MILNTRANSYHGPCRPRRCRRLLLGWRHILARPRGGTMDKQLEAVAENQGRWSATADAMKATFERTRFLVFVLSTLAALAAAISSQQPEGTARTTFAIVSTVFMGVVSFLGARLLDS